MCHYIALIQVLSLDDSTHRSDSGLKSELQGTPKSAQNWTDVANEHPEFFRVKPDGKHTISLVARHVIPKDMNGVRVMPPDFIGRLLDAAIQLHDREVERRNHWKAYIPVVVAVTAGVFTIIGAWLGGGT